MNTTQPRKHSPETIEKMRQANLGRKHSPETIEKLRKAKLGKKMSAESIAKRRKTMTGRKRTEEFRQKMRQIMNGRQMSPEVREKARLANTGRKRTPESIEKFRMAMIGRPCSEEKKEKIRRANKGKIPSIACIEAGKVAHKGVEETSLLTRKGATHFSSIRAWLRSPTGKVYHVVNVCQFVRDHAELFDSKDLIPTRPGRMPADYCNAMGCLGMVARIGKSAIPTWKGWTRVTAAECNLNDGVDLLQRGFSQSRQPT